jgi:hypothetical protein
MGSNPTRLLCQQERATTTSHAKRVLSNEKENRPTTGVEAGNHHDDRGRQLQHYQHYQMTAAAPAAAMNCQNHLLDGQYRSAAIRAAAKVAAAADDDSSSDSSSSKWESPPPEQPELPESPRRSTLGSHEIVDKVVPKLHAFIRANQSIMQVRPVASA